MKKTRHRSIRVRSDDSDDDVGSNPKIGSRPNASVLSFDDPSEESGVVNNNFMRNRDFEKSQFKKMMQAPVVAPDPIETKTEVQAYSSDALAALRSEQQFKSLSMEAQEDNFMQTDDYVEIKKYKIDLVQEGLERQLEQPVNVEHDLGGAPASSLPPSDKLSFTSAPFSLVSTSRLICEACNALEADQLTRAQKLNELQGRVDADTESAAKLRANLAPQLQDLHALESLRSLAGALIGLLREKRSQIEQLHDSYCVLLREMQDYRNRNRAEYAEDTFLQARLALGSNSRARIRVSKSYVAQASLKHSEEFAGLDVYGRSLEREHLVNADALAARQSVRRPRRQLINYLPLRDVSVCVEASDEEVAFVDIGERCACLAEAMTLLMIDAREDLYSVAAVLKELAQLRLSCETGMLSSHYRRMYVSLSLPQLLEPLIVLEMLRPAFLKPSGIALEPFALLDHCDWFQHIKRYVEDVNGMEKDPDGDSTLLLRVLAQAYLPKIKAFWEIAWDPLDAAQAMQYAANLQTIYTLLEQTADHSPARAELLHGVQLALEHVSSLYREVLMGGGTPYALLPTIEFEDANIMREGFEHCSALDSSTRATDFSEELREAFRNARNMLVPAIQLIKSRLQCVTIVLCNAQKFSNLKLGSNHPISVLVSEVLRSAPLRECCLRLLWLQLLELHTHDTDGVLLLNAYMIVSKLYVAGNGVVPITVKVDDLESFPLLHRSVQVQLVTSFMSELKILL